jgi:hypothetical protein
MVNQERIRKKLPELLVNGSLTKLENKQDYENFRYYLRRLDKQNSFIVEMRVRNIAKELESLMNTMKTS